MSFRIRHLLRRTSQFFAAALCGVALAACGGSSEGEPAPVTPTASDFPSAEGQTIEQILTAQTPSEMVVSPAAMVFDVGKQNRYPFGVFDVGGAMIEDAQVALYFAKSPTSKVEGPLPAENVSLVTKPAYRSQGADAPGEPNSFYVVNGVEFDRAGPWHGIALIKSGDGFESTRLPSPTVGGNPEVVQVGKKAPRTSTPTAADVGGDLSKIDTRQPPSSMHDVDFEDVAGKKPVVLVFATPALCQSRVCGPVVDVAEQVKDEFGDSVAFIHMEVYNENNPSKGLRSQLVDFGLPSEPWMFLIDRNGKVKQRIEGPVGVDELRADVERLKQAA